MIPPKTDDHVGRHMTTFELIRSRIAFRLARLRRKIPHLVWYGDELDVTVTFPEDRLNQDDPMVSFNRGAVRALEISLSELGIDFDRGQGCDGRDWEWDWSLSGPIHIAFRGRASRPERREPSIRSVKGAVT